MNNLILIGGDAAGLHYALCIMLTYVLVLPASYLAHANWTFDVPLSWAAFGRFLLGSLSGVAVASFTIWAFHGLMALPMAIAAPLATVTMVLYNYLSARWAMVWARRQVQAD